VGISHATALPQLAVDGVDALRGLDQVKHVLFLFLSR
jgi:hypothetical protein